MHCYCLDHMKIEFKKQNFDALDIQFTEYNKTDTEKYCLDWFENFVLQKGMVVGTSVVIAIINVITCTIFERTVSFERKHTINDETMAQFQRITIIQFINIGVVILLINFDLLDGELLGFIPLLNGEYKDFTVHWYSQVGKTLCLTLFINIFSPHASKLLIPVIKVLLRCIDRGCSCKLLKDDGSVNTKKLLVQDLEALYTGDQISSHYVYAQNYTYLWCVLMFSTGMPLLYPFAMIFYIVLFCVYKFLLLKYYQTTNRFNEQLPIESVAYIKSGLLFHLIIGSLMISNSEMIPDNGAEYNVEEFEIDVNEVLRENQGFELLLSIPGRLMRTTHSRLYVSLIAFLLICVALKKTLLQCLIKCFRGMESLIVDDDSKESTAYSRDIYKEFVIQSLDDLLEKSAIEKLEFD